MKRDDRVEYAVHPIAWQADGTWLPVTLTQEDLDSLPDDFVEQNNLQPIEEDWRPATVLDVIEHPVPIHTPDAESDVVVVLAPDDGQPPISLNQKLVREI